MYESFFHLSESPFGTTPDPRFLYRSRAHREALAYLARGVFGKRGFLALTGEVGIGKTTVIRAFTQTFEPCLDVSFVINTRVDFREMLYMLLTDFGVAVENDSKVAMLHRLNQLLIERFAEGRNAVAVIDEAQNLGPEVLEELRMLSNLETNDEKLIQIVLVGQPELAEVLRREDLRQLRQRIPGVFNIGFLSREEVYAYIRYRLGVAGLRNGSLVFSDAAIAAVHEFTAGIPRLINLICDRVLTEACQAGRRAIDRTLVDAAAAALADQMVDPRRPFRTAGGGLS